MTSSSDEDPRDGAASSVNSDSSSNGSIESTEHHGTGDDNNSTTTAAAHQDSNDDEVTSGNDRPLGNFHSRLLSRQRSNILLQVLFHHMVNNRRRRQEEEALAMNPPPLPDRPMPVLSHEEALSTNAMCRFCFDSSIEESASNNNNALVAPCNCSGGSRWVHLQCLRQWQRLQARNSSLDDSSTTYTAAGYICNVCNSPYLSRPPSVRAVRQNVLRRGTLLISKQNVGRTFTNTVILLLNDVTGGAFGVIINSPLAESSIPSRFNDNNNDDSNDDVDNNNNDDGEQDQSTTTTTAATTTNNDIIEWRRGGPVCGGRLGVVHYTILHTFPPNLYSSQDHVLDVDIDEEYFEEEHQHEDLDAATDDEDHDNDYDVDDVPSVEDIEHGAETFSTDEEEHDYVASFSDPDTDDEDDDVHDDHDAGNVSPAELEDEICAPLSLPVFDLARNDPPLQFVASSETQDPATFSEDNLSRIVPRIINNNSNTHPPETHDNDAATETENRTVSAAEDNNGTTTTSDQHKVFVFMGYCKWRAGQLQREIQRDLWSVCVDSSPADVLRHHSDSSFWEEMNESDRLLSWSQLMQEEEGEGGGTGEIEQA